MAIKISGTEVIDDNRNITTSIGTVDGRDVATDGTKLDGIETGATADQTKADIDALNINADLLDGQHGAYYTGYTDTAVSNLVDSSPATLNTLNELAAALGDDVNFSTTVTDSIATKLPLTGGAMTGAITTNSTFDGRDVATDGTKLDAIETGANVTDTANVTAAGALMDSELASVTAVKATTGTFLTADQSKLDGIEAGAKADQTFDQLLNKTSGTGEYSTSGYLQAGRGSGGVAMTHNDGYGNANLTFNHKQGVPEHATNIARIASNTDDTSNPNMSFQLGTAVTAGVALAASEEMKLLSTGLHVTNNITLGGTVEGRYVFSDGTKLDGIEAGATADQVGLVKGADISAGADLNTYTTNGYFHQNGNTNAQSGTNYPVALAGMLSVQADGSMVYQKYQAYDGTGTYQRTKYNNTWFAWDKILDSGNSPAVGSVGSYAWLGSASKRELTPGTIYAASGLKYAGSASSNTYSDNTAMAIRGAIPAGTWRAMGDTYTSGRYGATLFLRIS